MNTLIYRYIHISSNILNTFTFLLYIANKNNTYVYYLLFDPS